MTTYNARIERHKSEDLQGVNVYSLRDLDSYEIVDGCYNLAQLRRIAKKMNYNVEKKLYFFDIKQHCFR
jgi:hypothetical protein